MCRVAAHLGNAQSLDDLLFTAENSLVSQSVSPQLMSLLNIGGFGVVAWDEQSEDPDLPFSYRLPGVPVFDRNLKALAVKLRVTAAVAHVRGVVYDPEERVGPHNLHPFRFPGARIALAQNGDLHDFASMRFDLLPHLHPAIPAQIEGTTDTEWVYALVLSQLEDPFGPADPDELAGATVRALEILRDVRSRRGIRTQSPVNLVLTDGACLVATRFCFDYGWYPQDESFFAGEREFDFTTLWFRRGADGGSVQVASEPLDGDRRAWAEAEEYSMLVARKSAAGVDVDTREIAS